MKIINSIALTLVKADKLPKIASTKLNSNNPTSSQFMAPTITSVSAIEFIIFIS